MVSGRIKGHMPKESWSRCETPSMLYDTIKNPNCTHAKPKAAVKIAKVDTIETPENRLNREVLDRFNSNGLKLPHESFVAVVQVGKYVFLAIMLPPYLLIYGLPRWFILNICTPLFIETKHLFVSLGKMFKKKSAKVVDLMKGILDQLLGDALRVVKDQVWKANKFIRNVGIRITRRVAKTKEQLQNFAEKLNIPIFKRMKKKVNNFKFEDLFRSSHTNLAPFKKLRATTVKFSKFLMEKSAVPFVNAPTNFKKVTRKALNPLIKIKDVFNRLNLRAKLAPFVEKVQETRRKIERKIVGNLEFCTEWTKTHYHEIKPYIIDICKFVITPFNFIGSKVYHYQKAKLSKIGKFTQKIITPFSYALNKSLSGLKKAFEELSNNLKNKQQQASKWKRKGIDLILNVLQVVKKSAVLFIWLKRSLKKSFLLLIAKFKKIARSMWIYLRLLPNKTMSLFRVLWKYFAKAFDRAMNGVCFFIAVLWAVFYVGYYLLKEFNRAEAVKK